MASTRDGRSAAAPARGSRAELGAAGEQAAAELLMAKGHEVLDRNWRCARGELDLVTRDGPWLVATEVKTRRSLRSGHPLEAIDPAKLARLRRLAGLWRAAHPEARGRLRIDAVSVVVREGAPPELRHVEGIGA